MWTRLPSSALRLTGADRVDFVHGQMTGDLRRASTPGLVACAFLNVRGQIEAFARAYRRQDDVYLHLDEGAAPLLAARLRRYIIFDQVEVQDVSDVLRTLHLWPGQPPAQALPGWQDAGPEVQSFELTGPQTSAAQGTAGTVLAARVNRTGQFGLDLHYLAQHEDAVLAALSGPEAPLEVLEEARIQAGIPDPARDGFLGTLPQEIGLDLGGPLPAISYRKGCYVGQEIMARLEARGNTRYGLALLEVLEGQELPSHAPITLDGKVVGQAGASAGGRSLARLRKELTPGTAVQVGNAVARILALPTSVTP